MARRGTPITFYADNGLLVSIEAKRRALGVNRSELVRLAITQFLLAEEEAISKKREKK